MGYYLASIPKYNDAIWINCKMILNEAVFPEQKIIRNSDGQEVVQIVFPTPQTLAQTLKTHAEPTKPEIKIMRLQDEIKELQYKITTLDAEKKKLAGDLKIAQKAVVARGPPVFSSVPTLSPVGSTATGARPPPSPFHP